MTGYWRQPEATAEVLRGDWLRTGDLATVDDEGFFTLVGRARDMYISGGENVFPREVEDLLADHPDVIEASVIGVADDEFGQRLKGFVVLGDGATVDESALKEYVKNNLARYKVPRDIVFLKELPRNPTGKVLKRVLAEMWGPPAAYGRRCFWVSSSGRRKQPTVRFRPRR